MDVQLFFVEGGVDGLTVNGDGQVHEVEGGGSFGDNLFEIVIGINILTEL